MNWEAVGDWLIGLGDGAAKFIGTYVPGLDNAYESLKRKVNGGSGNYRKDAEALATAIQEAYKTLYGSRPVSPSDLQVLTTSQAKERYLDIKSRARGSDLEAAARKVYAKISREADEASKEYSKALSAYEQGTKDFEIKAAGLQQAEIQAKEALDNPQWKGKSPSQIIKDYEQGV